MNVTLRRVPNPMGEETSGLGNGFRSVSTKPTPCYEVLVDGEVVGRVVKEKVTRERRTPGRRYVNARWYGLAWFGYVGTGRRGFEQEVRWRAVSDVLAGHLGVEPWETHDAAQAAKEVR